MNLLFVKLFLYLASVYTLSGIFISIGRRLKAPDFVANILAGLVIGLALTSLSMMFSPDFLNVFSDPQTAAYVHFLVYTGVLIFFVQIGFNIDLRFLKPDPMGLMTLAGVLAGILVLVLGFSGYFLIFDGGLKPTLALVISLMSINLGAVLASNFPMPANYKKPFTDLVHISIILDLLVIIIFSAVNFFWYYQDYSFQDFDADFIYWLILIVFIVMAAVPRKSLSFFKMFPEWMGEHLFFLKMGIFFLFLFAGFRVGISILLMGLWAGWLLRIFAGKSQEMVREKVFSSTSFLYILPFVEIGRSLMTTAGAAEIPWSSTVVILISLGAVSLLIAVALLNKKEYPLVALLGTFPRGDISLLILWMFWQAEILKFPFFVAAVVAVVLSSLIAGFGGQLVFSKMKGRKGTL